MKFRHREHGGNRHLITDVFVPASSTEPEKPVVIPGQTVAGSYVDGPGPSLPRNEDGTIDMTDQEKQAWFIEQLKEIRLLAKLAEEKSGRDLGSGDL